MFYRKVITGKLAHLSFTEDGPTNEFHGVLDVGNMVRFLIIISWTEHIMMGNFFKKDSSRQKKEHDQLYPKKLSYSADELTN